jgi:hypothetical protein
MSTLRTAGMHAGPSVVERAMENLPSERFAKQIEEIGSVGRFAKQIEDIGRVGRFAEHLQAMGSVGRAAKQIEEMRSVTDVGLGKGLAGHLGGDRGIAKWASAGVAPGIAQSIKGSLGAGAAFPDHRASVMADLERVDAMRANHTRLLDQMAGTGMTRAWEGTLATGLVGDGHLQALKAAEAMRAEAKRITAMTTRELGPLQRTSALEAAAAQQYLRTPLAAKGFLSPGRFTSVLGESSITAAARFAEASSMATLAKQVSAFGTIAMPRIGLPDGLAEFLERERVVDTTVERFTKRWEGSALWFLLSVLGVRQIFSLARLDREGIEAVLLDALEAVITEGRFTEALSATLEKAPHVSADQRDDLRHGLEHAGHGEFGRAVPPLMVGLEGAIWSAARAHTVVDERRQLIGRPTKGAVARIEPVVRKLSAKQDYVTFVCSRVFGDVGNPVRHGEQSDRRRQALFAIVAIVGWADVFMGVRAREALGRLLREELRSRRA